MKTLSVRMIFYGLAVLIFLMPALCFSADGAPPEIDPARMKQIQKKISDALEEAKRTGKTSIDVYLDEIEDEVQTGDLVQVMYTAQLDSGNLLTPQTGEIQQIIAGEKTQIPGLGQAVIGLNLLGKRKVTIEPENAFGRHEDGKTQRFPAVRVLPVIMKTTPQTFKSQFDSQPDTGGQVVVAPYFKSRVIEVSEDRVLIENLARDGYVEHSPFGETSVSVQGDLIYIRLNAKTGAPFFFGERKGFIVSADQENFTVDYNHPLAGRKLVLDLEIKKITKPSVFKKIDLGWIDDHEKGYQAAMDLKKNKVLVLYADWCQWCEKLFAQTFEDPRIKMLKDQFVWVKANSDEDQSLKSFYGQKGFPMVVLTDDTGRILKKMEGFKDALAMLDELEKVINPRVVKAE